MDAIICTGCRDRRSKGKGEREKTEKENLSQISYSHRILFELIVPILRSEGEEEATAKAKSEGQLLDGEERQKEHFCSIYMALES